MCVRVTETCGVFNFCPARCHLGDCIPRWSLTAYWRTGEDLRSVYIVRVCL